MTMKGIKLESRGKEIVNLYGDTRKRTVYTIPNQWKFFVKVDGEFVEVFHKSCWFSAQA